MKVVQQYVAKMSSVNLYTYYSSSVCVVHVLWNIVV
jgi:hypothetical protein